MEETKDEQQKQVQQEEQIITYKLTNDENAPISIEVVNPINKEGKIGSFTIYTIRGKDSEGQFTSERRYSDFVHFRMALIARWPGCYIPPIPSKKAFGNLESGFVEERRRHLQYFCEKLAEFKYLYYSPEGRIFFRSQSQEVERLITELPKYSSDQILNIYKQAFQEYINYQMTSEIQMKINGFKIFLKQAIPNLENMKRFAENLKNSKQEFGEQFQQLSTIVMPQYEKNCASQYFDHQNELLVFQTNENIKGLSESIMVEQKTNSFEQFYDFIKTEFKEIEAITEAIEGNEQYKQSLDKLKLKLQEDQLEAQKLQSGKSTFKSIFTSGSKEEQVSKIKKQMIDTQKQIEIYKQLCEIQSLVLGYLEIDRFKSGKQQKYYKVLHAVSQREIVLNGQYINLWQEVNASAINLLQQNQN